jgi:hypothetical protein
LINFIKLLMAKLLKKFKILLLLLMYRVMIN